MFDLGLGSYLTMVEARYGRFWSGLLMIVIYFAIMAVCLPLIWNNLLTPGYNGALIIWDWIAKGTFVLPVLGWWDWIRRGVAAIVAGGATLLMGSLFGLLGYGARLVFQAFYSGEFKKEYARLKAERERRNT